MQSDTEKCHTVITVVLPPDDGDDGDVDAVGHSQRHSVTQ